MVREAGPKNVAGLRERSESTRARNSMCAWVAYVCVCAPGFVSVYLCWSGEVSAGHGGEDEARLER